MSMDAKQREWIWEFFLKNCTDGPMIQELTNALPFPDENLDLKRMFLLRSLSLQVSAGIIDELTLDMLMGLGELSRASAVTRRERLVADFSCQEIAKRRKVSEYESNDDEATNSSTPQVKDGSVPSRNLEQCRESSKDTRKAETVVGSRDWMKRRALPRSVGGRGDLSKGNALNMEMEYPDSAATPLGTGDLPGNNLFFRPDQSREHCELELAVLLELAVKHLRGDSPHRKSFESAVTKYWGDSSDDTEGWHGADIPGMVGVRDQIRSELWMVRRNPELLDHVVQKYTKVRVEDLLKIYLEKAWAATGQTFLERVSADVVHRKYNPVNCNGQRSKRVGSPLGDRDAGQQSGGKADTSEKPWIRCSRGKYSRTREKKQKSFAIWELGDADEAGAATAKPPIDGSARDGEEIIAEHAGRGSRQPDGEHGDEDAVNLKNKALEGGERRPSLTTEGGFENNARSLRFDGSVARVLEFEEPSGPESEDGKQLCQEKEGIVTADIEATEVVHLLHQTNKSRTVSGEGGDMDIALDSPSICAPDMGKDLGNSNGINLSEAKDTSTTDDEKRTRVKAAGDSNVIDLSEGKETSTTDDEKRREETSSPKNTNWRDAEARSPHEVVNKETVVPPSSSKPMDSNPTVCFSPPPWGPLHQFVYNHEAMVAVEGSPAVPLEEGIAQRVRRNRRHGSSQGETDASTGREEWNSAEDTAPTHCNSQSPDALSTQRNLRRKQLVLDAVLQDPLPKILTTSRARGNLLERNATARTVEWEDDDDIEDSPSNSPSASRHVRLPRPTTETKISPLAGSKTRGIMNAKHVRRKPRRWSEKEVESLKRAVGAYGKGRWKMILENNQAAFQGRTEVDLKDKWRNLEKFEGITV